MHTLSIKYVCPMYCAIGYTLLFRIDNETMIRKHVNEIFEPHSTNRIRELNSLIYVILGKYHFDHFRVNFARS